MRLVLLLLAALMSSSVFSMTIKAEWNKVSFEKELLVGCNQNDSYLCIDLCNSEYSCKVKENYCRNCAGDNIFLKTIFNELGRTYQNSKNKISDDDFISFIKEDNFVTLTSKSIYNTIDKFNSPKLKRKFRSLCENPTEYPIVFLEVNPVSRVPEKVKYVGCSDNKFESEIYTMKQVYDVEVSQ